jgi:hypothetical protein
LCISYIIKIHPSLSVIRLSVVSHEHFFVSRYSCVSSHTQVCACSLHWPYVQHLHCHYSDRNSSVAFLSRKCFIVTFQAVLNVLLLLFAALNTIENRLMIKCVVAYSCGYVGLCPLCWSRYKNPHVLWDTKLGFTFC